MQHFSAFFSNVLGSMDFGRTSRARALISIDPEGPRRTSLGTGSVNMIVLIAGPRVCGSLATVSLDDRHPDDQTLGRVPGIPALRAECAR